MEQITQLETSHTEELFPAYFDTEPAHISKALLMQASELKGGQFLDSSPSFAAGNHNAKINM